MYHLKDKTILYFLTYKMNCKKAVPRVSNDKPQAQQSEQPLVFTENVSKNPVKKIVSIIVTHQNRIKCFLNSFMKIKHSLGNTSVIELSLKRE